MSPLRIGLLVLLASLARGSLPPPRNLTLLSKDFRLFLTWMPGEGCPPGVSYTAQWKDPYFPQWKDVPHCRGIPETSCDVTCVPSELENRYWVQVRGQVGSDEAGMVTSGWAQQRDIDYAVHVTPAPPVLRLRKKDNSLRVNATFSYPWCTADIFRHQVFYDLDVWTPGIGSGKKYKHLRDPMELNTTHWSSGNYCFHAQSYFQANKKWSSVSEPVCTQISGKVAAPRGAAKMWGFATFLMLLMASAGPLSVFYWYRSKLEHARMPQVLDFSRLRNRWTSVDFGEMELVAVEVLVCMGSPSNTGKRDRPACRIALTWSPSPRSLSEEDDDDDSGNPIPYTEMLRFKQQRRKNQRAGRHPKTPCPSSKPGQTQASGRCFPDVTVLEPFVSTGWQLQNTSSGFSESQCSPISQNSSMDDVSDFGVTSSSVSTEEQEEANGDTDVLFFWPRLAEGLDITSPAVEGNHPEASCGQLDVSHLLEDHFTHRKDFKKDLSCCRELLEEIPLEEGSCKKDIDYAGLESHGATGVLSSSRFHDYVPRRVHYVPRTQME